ncbi:MAG: DUF2183 domain-containing protein [Chitinophagaceae bacterium]|jgi:phosphatidate phosphatase APP1|nr:DUF2183 domain-containing protein [Chitinophagaceae bacterium]
MPVKGFFQKLYKKLLWRLRLTNHPVVQVYNGYGNKRHVFIYGHVFKFSPVPRKKFRRFYVTNAFALIRSFMVKPWSNVKLKLVWDGQVIEGSSGQDGFFKFEWAPGLEVKEGWHPVQVQALHPETGQIISAGEGLVFIPHEHQYAIISDIDDTFLISHSAKLRKRLYVLLTKNAHSRKPFEGVVKHYQLLAGAGSLHDLPNPFFYVSSSEWNLYDFIVEFSIRNELPKGIYLLSQLKKLHQVLNTGQGKHSAKFMKIVRIMEAFPDQKFILSGDDSQEDPNIYSSIVKHFPERIQVVYLRRIHGPNEEKTMESVNFIRKMNVPCCYFTHSSEAIAHSKETGLISSL